jgi:hypothetical protein
MPIFTIKMTREGTKPGVTSVTAQRGGAGQDHAADRSPWRTADSLGLQSVGRDREMSAADVD